MTAYVKFRGRTIAEGWPATIIIIIIMIVFLYVMFCVLVSVSALATYGMLATVSWVAS